MMKKIQYLLVLLSFVIVPIISYGQDGVPPPPPVCPGTSNEGNKMGPTSSPLEDGTPVVLILAFLYGAYKLRQGIKKPATVEVECSKVDA